MCLADYILINSKIIMVTYLETIFTVFSSPTNPHIYSAYFTTTVEWDVLEQGDRRFAVFFSSNFASPSLS